MMFVLGMNDAWFWLNPKGRQRFEKALVNWLEEAEDGADDGGCKQGYYQFLGNSKNRHQGIGIFWSEKTKIGSASSSGALVNKLNIAISSLAWFRPVTETWLSGCMQGLITFYPSSMQNYVIPVEGFDIAVSGEDLCNPESWPYLVKLNGPVRKGEHMFPPLAFNATYISCVLSSSQGWKLFEKVVLRRRKEESSGEGESSSDDEVPVTKQVAAKKSKLESSSSESDDGDSEEVKPKASAPAKKDAAAPTKNANFKKKDKSSSDDSSGDSRSEDVSFH
ncbi:hypothetical protein MKW98_028871 [Papaver atlanticum]|uniref:Uncharacterized protein n=1 Tax=Papaver atlanticum TaxID=357466 RepID=A0AAD4S2I8_9MAGN|nr:hypothetical protein MKW98_028871 [Papaver atlanticum]